MLFYNFSIYDKESEMPGGGYWTFLDSTTQDIEQSGVYFYDFLRVWNGLTNEELKNIFRNIYGFIIHKKT